MKFHTFLVKMQIKIDLYHFATSLSTPRPSQPPSLKPSSRSSLHVDSLLLISIIIHVCAHTQISLP